MTSDSLTKPMVHESMLLLLTTGIVRFFNVEKHHVTSRLLPTLEDYDEHDIVKSDTEIMKDIEDETKKVKIGHSLVLLGLVALCEKKTVKAMMAVSMAATAQAAYVNEYPLEVQAVQRNDESFFTVYVMVFFTVIMAILVERLGRYGMNYIIVMMGYQEVKPEQVTKLLPVKIEEDSPVPMEVDYSSLDFDDMPKPGEVSSTIRAMNKKIRQLTEEKDELSVTVHIRQDVIDRLEEEIEEKKKESISWQVFAQDQSAAIEKLKEDKKFAVQEEQDTKTQCEKLRDEIDENDTKIGQLNVQINTLEQKVEKAKNDLETQKNLTVTANRQVLILQDRLAERQKQIEEQRQKISEDRANKIPLFGNQASSAYENPEARLRAEIETKNREKAELQSRYDLLVGEVQRLRGREKAPAKIYVTRSGSCFHQAGCNHLKHGQQDRAKVEYSRCRDCLE